MAQAEACAASGGGFERSRSLGRAGFFGETVANWALESVSGNRGGHFQIAFQKVQKQAVFAQQLPFRQGKLGDEMFVALIARHRVEGG